MKVSWKEPEIVGHGKDTFGEYPRTKERERSGHIIGYVQRYETGASAIILELGTGEISVVDVTELTVIVERSGHMIWEREAFNYYRAGLSTSEIARKLFETRGLDYFREDIEYAIELCKAGPVRGYETL